MKRDVYWGFSYTVSLSVCFAYQITLSSAATFEAKFQCRQTFELQLNFLESAQNTRHENRDIFSQRNDKRM